MRYSAIADYAFTACIEVNGICIVR